MRPHENKSLDCTKVDETPRHSTNRYAIRPSSSDPAQATGSFLSLQEMETHVNSGLGALEAEAERLEAKQEAIAGLRRRLDKVLSSAEPEITKEYIRLIEHNSIDDFGQLSFIVTRLEQMNLKMAQKRFDTMPGRKKPLSESPANQKM